jgi:hypothetical protein
MTPSEELTITAGSASPKASLRRALVPVCTGIKAPTRNAIAKKSHERFMPSHSDAAAMGSASRPAAAGSVRTRRVKGTRMSTQKKSMERSQNSSA